MDTLLDEHLLCIASALDGDSYLTLAQTTKDLRAKMNEKSFLSAVTEANTKSVVVDASFYSYDYSQHFLGARSIRNVSNFYKVLKRTIQADKMTEQSYETLKKQIVKFMIAVIQTKDTFAEEQLHKISLRLLDNLIGVEILHFNWLYDNDGVQREKKTDEYYQIKEGKLPVDIQDVGACVRVAIRYRQHEILYYLLEHYRSQLGGAEYYLDHYTNAVSAKALLAALPFDLTIFERGLVYYSEVACCNDDPEVLDVFWHYFKVRLDSVQFFLFANECLMRTIEGDCVRCFDYLLQKSTEKEVNLPIKIILIKRNALRIMKYYALQATWLELKITALL